MNVMLVTGLTFVAVTAIVFVILAMLAARGQVRARLAPQSLAPGAGALTVLRDAVQQRFPWLEQMATRLPWARPLKQLTEQAGWEGRSGQALGLILLAAVVAGLIGAVRMGQWLWGIPWAVTGGAIPVLHLRFRRQKRVEKFREQFPEALDMMTRSLRSGYALGSSFQMVSEEMPDPVGSEFKRVFEEISLGRPPGEALWEMYDRIKTEEVRFFYVAVSIQREVGGNLAEILDKLSEVIRERFKLLAFAQMISAQQRATAYCVAASPFAVAIALSFLNPGWFEPLWTWPYWKVFMAGGLFLQLAGFFALRRIANIVV
jgi:tight adherence protein B